MNSWLLSAQFGAYNSPLVAELIVKFEHFLLLVITPVVLGVGRIDVGGVSEWADDYLSLHCLPFLPLTP